MEGEREEIEAAHKFSNFNDVLGGQMSGTISMTVQDEDGDPGQEILKAAFEANTMFHIREEGWDGNDETTLAPIRQTTGILLSDPLGRDLPIDDLATAELEITRKSRWTDVPAPTTTTTTA